MSSIFNLMRISIYIIKGYCREVFACLHVIMYLALLCDIRRWVPSVSFRSRSTTIFFATKETQNAYWSRDGEEVWELKATESGHEYCSLGMLGQSDSTWLLESIWVEDWYVSTPQTPAYFKPHLFLATSSGGNLSYDSWIWGCAEKVSQRDLGEHKFECVTLPTSFSLRKIPWGKSHFSS